MTGAFESGTSFESGTASAYAMSACRYPVGRFRRERIEEKHEDADMKMLHPNITHDLTYDDVYMVPNRSAVRSRLDVDLTTPDGVGTTIPIVVANMTAVAGRRMAEVVARRGGIAVLPQDIPSDVIREVIAWVKLRHPCFETPIKLSPTDTIGEALSLIHKRAHGAVIVVDGGDRPVGVFTEDDAVGFDRFTQLQHVMSPNPDTLDADVTPEEAFNRLHGARRSLAPVVDGNGKLLGVLTSKGALRSTIYRPAVDSNGCLRVAVAIGINADPVGRAREVVAAGADVLVVDTAHGHQDRMLDVVAAVRAACPSTPLVAGNVVTAEGTRDLINAGADVVKVGVGPRCNVYHSHDDRCGSPAVHIGGRLFGGGRPAGQACVGRRRCAVSARRCVGARRRSGQRHDWLVARRHP